MENGQSHGPYGTNRARAGVTVGIVTVTLCFFIIIPKGPPVVELPQISSPWRKFGYSKPEKRHIAFLKVHKAASSTVQNILFRFGLDRGLNFVLPVSGNRFSENTSSHLPIMSPPKGQKFDIFSLHSSFNLTTISRLLHNDSMYIGIVRNPLDVMVSSAYYNRDVWNVDYLRDVPYSDFIKSLIDHPEKYDKQEFSLTKNSMAADFGFPRGLHRDNSSQIKEYLRQLGAIFKLVMIVEYFDESLILLRRYAGWKLSDMLYIPLNDHTHETVNSSFDGHTVEKFKHRNFLDCMLYDFFYQRFFHQVGDEGDDFYEEVRHFKQIQHKMQLFCLLVSKAESISELQVNSSKWNDEFTLNKWDCDIMKMGELKFIERLRKRNLQR